MDAANREIILSFDDTTPVSAAVKEDGQLVEYTELSAGTVGGIYCARITEYIKAYGACFAEIGEERRGYLNSDMYRAGDWVLCQVSGEAHEKKGMRLTDNVKISGAYLVLLGSGSVGISGKIQDPEVRRQLHTLGGNMLQGCGDPSVGVIFRTEAQYVSEELLKQEFQNLIQRGRQIRRQFQEAKRNGAAKIIEKPDMLQKILYRYPPSTVTSLVGDSAAALHEIEVQHPAFCQKTCLCKAPAMDTQGISRELAVLTGRRVWLKSGGYLVFDKTEAMTVIDVNSGKMSGAGTPASLARKVNVEAAKELMRQLRLRSLGGMILCDMIDMESEEDRCELLDFMGKMAEKDPEETEIHDITKLGIVEITRKRTKNAEYLDKRG